MPRIESWIIFAASVAAIVIVSLLVVKSYKYIRALAKRWQLMHSLKRVCRLKNYKMEKLSSYYRSIFRASDKNEILITTPKKKYCIKFFTCLRYKDTYTFADVKHYTTASNAGMTLVNMNPFISGISKKDPSLQIPHFSKVKNEGVTEFEITGGEVGDASRSYADAEMILCISPIPIEMRRVKGNTTVQMFDGDELDGYVVYSGKALLSYLNR